jgi:hypothetical protein
VTEAVQEADGVSLAGELADGVLAGPVVVVTPLDEQSLAVAVVDDAADAEPPPTGLVVG